MLINGHSLDIDRAIHDISMECAKMEVELAVKNGCCTDEQKDDISWYLDRMFKAYVANFDHLSRKANAEIQAILES